MFHVLVVDTINRFSSVFCETEIDNGNWEKMSTLGSAMPGTDIACTVFKTSEPKPDGISYRIFGSDVLNTVHAMSVPGIAEPRVDIFRSMELKVSHQMTSVLSLLTGDR
jgi:hypothetical protein